MEVVQNFLSGIKSIISGGVKIVVAAGMATWAMLKIACKAALWIVKGVFTMAKAGFDYVISTISKFFKPRAIETLTKQTIFDLKNFIDQKFEEGNVTVEGGEILVDMSNRLKNAYDNDEALIIARGEDEEGNETLAEPKFVKADDYDERIKDAGNNGKIYVKKVRIAG
mgnify:CR=1 FL=1